MTEPSPETPTPETPSGDTDFEPITTQQQLDKIIKGFEQRYKSKISELKTKADKFDELEQANKSETQRAAERITALETELNKERLQRLIDVVAAEQTVPAHRLSGTTREELEASAEEYKTEIAEQAAKLNPPTSPRKPYKASGATGTDTRMDPKERVAQLFRQAYGPG